MILVFFYSKYFILELSHLVPIFYLDKKFIKKKEERRMKETKREKNDKEKEKNYILRVSFFAKCRMQNAELMAYF